MKIKKNIPLKRLTTMRIGGNARYFTAVKSEKDLVQALEFARKNSLAWRVVGEGSNLIAGDRGFEGLVIQNQIQKFDLTRPAATLSRPGEGKGRGRVVTVGAGNNLLKFIFRLNKLGLAGLEKMAGIAGGVGGAIYGSAGAYGQEIKDRVIKVRIYDGKRFRHLTKKQCRFGYRDSIFKKHKDWILTEAVLQLSKGSPKKLQKASREIMKLREKKYKPGLKCPGSFFKNIKLTDLSPAERRRFLEKIDKKQIKYGKVPAGYLLEQVMARGMRQNTVMVASHHGNLIYNPRGGRARDVKKLAQRLKRLVKNKFGIIIEEEIQYLE